MIQIKVPEKPKSLIPINNPDVKIKSQDYVWNKLVLQLKKTVSDLIKPLEPNENINIEEPPINIDGDLAFACFSLAKKLKKNPNDIALDLVSKLNKIKEALPLIFNIYQSGAYVNFDINTDVFGKEVLNQIEQFKENYGDQNIGDNQVIVFDTSSPNIAKFMSIGHLRSTVIGESLAQIYKSLGYMPIRDSHLGDWGTQFGMLGAAYDKWGGEIPELKSENDREIVNGLYKLYVKMHMEIEKEKENNLEDSELDKSGKIWFEKLEKGDLEAQKLWNWALNLSLKEFQKVYNLMDVDFEYMIGESQYVPMVKDIINLLLEKKIAEKDKSGAIIVKFDEKGENKLVIQKTDGTSLYSTRDLGTLIARKQWFDPKKILYCVGVEQKSYFEQIFNIYKKIEDNPAELKHVYSGLIKLPSGRMSTRKGNVIFLEEFLEKAINLAKEKIIENNKNISESELEKLSKIIGIGAVKFFDLGQGRERNIKFDWEKALSFEGYGSPYIQYAYTRAQSILKKASQKNIEIKENLEFKFKSEYEKSLIKEIAKFPDIILKASLTNHPSKVAEYVYNLASIFSQFYKNNPVIEVKDKILQNTRLRLIRATASVIKKGLQLLSIESPEKM
ncbi:MAG: arginine--tRNA ligase [bacterium]